MQSNVKIKKVKMPSRYTFSSIFSYNPNGPVIVPIVRVYINGYIFPAGAAIIPSTQTGPLNIFNYIGRDIAGTWDATSQTLTVAGFY
jgi:hypothetical protein